MSLGSFLKRLWRSRPQATRRAKPSRRRQTLSLESLETRSMMAVVVANRLADITITPTSVTVSSTGPAANPLERVLVVDGTAASDSLSVVPGTAPGDLDVIFNGARTTYSGPFAAVVMHGEAGNDTLTMDPALSIRGYLFGGYGSDTLLGGAGNDVLVGGLGNDVLQGRAGRDLILGGSGADQLYGNNSAIGQSDADNFLVTDLFASDHSLAMLRDLSDQWSSGNSLDARTASLRATLVPATRADGNVDQVFKPNASDPHLAFSWWWYIDVVKFSVPGVTATWYASPPAGAKVANRLSDISVTPTSVTVSASAAGNPGDRVLVLDGTAASDVITVTRSPYNGNDFLIAYNTITTYFAGPFSAILVHGEGGSDRITIDPAISINTFLFGGYGNDTLTGAAGSDIIIGGEGADILTGRGGRDLLLGGNGADKLYGNGSDADGLANADNVLVTDYYSGDHSLAALQDLATRWRSADTLASRTASVRSVLVPATTGDASYDQAFKGNATDPSLSFSYGWYTDKVLYGVPGISGAWFSHSTIDADGFEVFSVESIYQAGPTVIRVLRPQNFSSLQVNRTVYVLPVEAGLGKQYGDGLATVKSLGAIGGQNTLFVSPSFYNLPWYADNPLNAKIRQETYLRDVVAPFIEHQYPVLAAPEGRLLLGFSKSGYGAFSMLLRNLDFYGKAFAWDAPLAMTNPSYFAGLGSIYGTAQNIEDYRVFTLLAAHASELRNQPQRLFMMGYSGWYNDMQAADQLMDSLAIPHWYDPGTLFAHRWDSGWMGAAVTRLLA